MGKFATIKKSATTWQNPLSAEAVLQPVKAGTTQTDLFQAATDRPKAPDAPEPPPEETPEDSVVAMPDQYDEQARKRRQRSAAIRASGGGRAATTLSASRPGTLG